MNNAWKNNFWRWTLCQKPNSRKAIENWKKKELIKLNSRILCIENFFNFVRSAGRRKMSIEHDIYTLTRSSVSLPAGFYRQRFGTRVSSRGTWEALNNASRWKVCKSVRHVIFLTRLTSSRGKRSACPATLIVTKRQFSVFSRVTSFA